MSMLNIAKRLKKPLQEAKADTQRLIDFAGEDLANRFLAVKQKLKAPENDLYYWIKNKSVEELEQFVLEVENSKSKTQQTKDLADAGAKLVCDSAHWKVYHITTFEAAQKYGRDTKWCITGVDNYGDQYWKNYKSRGIEFYFLITKGSYDPRGEDSKFAIALYPDGQGEVYNQPNELVSFDEIPYVDEIDIPGYDLDDIAWEYPEDEEYLYCTACDSEVDEGDACYGPDGDPYCYDCWSDRFFTCEYCGEVFDDDEICWFEEEPYCETCYAKLCKEMGFNPNDPKYKYLNDPFDTGFCISFDNSDKTETGYRLNVEDALNKILTFINTLTQEEKDNLYMDWRCKSSDGDSPEDYEDFMIAYEGNIIVTVNSPEITTEERTAASYEEAEIKIRRALGVPAITPGEYKNFSERVENTENTRYSLYVNDDIKKTVDKIPLNKALKEIIDFIIQLSPKDRDAFSLSWEWVYDNAEGDVVVGVFSKDECAEYGYDFETGRVISNHYDAEQFIKRALYNVSTTEPVPVLDSANNNDNDDEFNPRAIIPSEAFTKYLDPKIPFRAELLAYNDDDGSNFVGDDGADNPAHMTGTLPELITKLNKLSENHSIGMLFLYPVADSDIDFVSYTMDEDGKFILKYHKSISKNEPFIQRIKKEDGDSLEEILLESKKTCSKKSLKESLHKTASKLTQEAEFKLYENLWS